jgi:hypothetical protein
VDYFDDADQQRQRTYTIGLQVLEYAFSLCLLTPPVPLLMLCESAAISKCLHFAECEPKVHFARVKVEPTVTFTGGLVSTRRYERSYAVVARLKSVTISLSYLVSRSFVLTMGAH